MRRTALALSLMLASVHVTAADVPGSKDHPLIRRYEGSTIVHYETKNYESVRVPTGKLEHNGKYHFPKNADVEGDVTRIRYAAPVGRTSLEVFRNYETALKEAKFEILYSCVKAACGDADTFAQTLYGVGAVPLTLNQKSQAFLSARLQRMSGDVYVRLFTVENHSWASEAKMQEGQVVAQLDIVQTKTMQSGMVTVDANGMRKSIRDTGRVALYGIFFESGKSEMKAESKPALDEIAKLMKLETSMRLLVVGHTDTDGTLPSNQSLSEQRARAVVVQLTTIHKIAAARLTPVGVGFAAPVATNRTSDGKAKNRRVELVEY